MFAAAAGIVFGFQNWRAAEYGFSLSLSWFGSGLILLTGLLLGLTIGATAPRPNGLRGGLFGMIFSLPTTIIAIHAGLRWFPYSAAAIVASAVAGFLIALLTDTIFP